MGYQTSWTPEQYKLYMREYHRKKKGVKEERQYISSSVLPRKVRLAGCTTLEEYQEKHPKKQYPTLKTPRIECTCGMEIFDTEISKSRHLAGKNHQLYASKIAVETKDQI